VFFLPFLLLVLSNAGSWWSVQTAGADTNLRGVSVILAPGKNDQLHDLIWASGSNGTILRSIDDGNTWQQIPVAGASTLDFRDVEAFSANEAYVMSIGDQGQSRIYKTTDGGKNWQLQYSDKRLGFFLDSMACDSEEHCVAVGDPVDGKFVVLQTLDGQHWSELPQDKMPPALPKEGAFAASGTIIALCSEGMLFGTGGPAARIFRSTDGGQSWTVTETPIGGGTDSRGVFSIACGGPNDLVAVGGDYKRPDDNKNVAVYSHDAGKTWSLAETQPGGFRSAVASFSYGDFAAVGPNGTDISIDRGAHWRRSDKLNLNAVAFEGTNGWAVGPKGTVARFKTHFEYGFRKVSPRDAGELAINPAISVLQNRTAGSTGSSGRRSNFHLAASQTMSE
jgi:photosystem II stability/assembly factor-like uncharacterized protein